jgi:hypothetical protein
VDAKEDAPGEFGGTGVTGGDRTAQGVGDVVHIPEGLLVGKGETLVYFVIKVKER